MLGDSWLDLDRDLLARHSMDAQIDGTWMSGHPVDEIDHESEKKANKKN